jgi:tetratricopeptide (TPR) repeat protein
VRQERGRADRRDRGQTGGRDRSRSEQRRPNRPREPADDPPIPADITGRELEPAVRRELAGLSPERAELVARHLVVAGQLLDEDPEEAHRHARTARRLAARLGVVREAIAITAYHTGRFDEALAEFRAHRRITGSFAHWPIMADCERGLGRPERALQMAGAPEAQRLEPSARAEMRIVAAGARRDLGQLEAALVTLDVPDLRGPVQPWTARLRYAYADALSAAGRPDEAKDWFTRAAEADDDGETGAAERLAELDGVAFVDDD